MKINNLREFIKYINDDNETEIDQMVEMYAMVFNYTKGIDYNNKQELKDKFYKK